MATHLVVKDFEKFQRYKDRRPPWIKLYRWLLDDYELMAMPGDTFRLLICLWIMASEFENKIPRDQAEWRLHIDGDSFGTLLEPLLHTGHVREVCK